MKVHNIILFVVGLACVTERHNNKKQYLTNICDNKQRKYAQKSMTQIRGQRVTITTVSQ